MPPRPQTYIAQVIGLTAAMMAAIAAGNYAVDPFGIFATPRWPGLTEQRPGLHNRDRMVKAYAIRRLRPDALLLGTSRVQFGIDPNDPALRARAARPYNAGLVNASFTMALRYLQHAQANGQVELALLGIDPLMFDADAPAALRDFSAQRLDADAAGRRVSHWTYGDLPLALASSTAVRLSVETVVHQREVLTDLLDDGLRNPAVLETFSRATGTLADNVALIERDYVSELSAAHFRDAAGRCAALAELRSLLDFARAHHIALQLFFTPGHVRMLEVMRATGQLAIADGLRREVVALVASEARDSGAAPVPVWDFSLPNAVTTSPLPEAEPGEPPRYWESSHFRAPVGHLLLARMLGEALPPDVADFGTRLTPGNVAAVGVRGAADFAAWERDHRAAVDQIAGYAAAEAAQRAARAAARQARGGRA